MDAPPVLGEWTPAKKADVLDDIMFEYAALEDGARASGKVKTEADELALFRDFLRVKLDMDPLVGGSKGNDSCGKRRLETKRRLGLTGEKPNFAVK